jgi:inner membrane protease ATP23
LVEAAELPLVSLLLAGLARAGCPVRLARHLVCEPCPPGLVGGYDSHLNQVVVCSEKCRDLRAVQTVLSHELVHMYDQCTARVDWGDMMHLACSEVRAANLAHCLEPFSAALRDGAPLPSSQAACVRSKAARSVRLVGGVTQEEADRLVGAVFQRCYPDLEPVGRRGGGGLAVGARAAREEAWRRGRTAGDA